MIAGVESKISSVLSDERTSYGLLKVYFCSDVFRTETDEKVLRQKRNYWSGDQCEKTDLLALSLSSIYSRLTEYSEFRVSCRQSVKECGALQYFI